MSNIFLQASRRAIRFPSPLGGLTVEDLWNIPLFSSNSKEVSLDSVGSALLEQQEKAKTRSILKSGALTQAQQDLNLAVDVIREVARIRQEENQARTVEAAKASERKRLDALIAAKTEQSMTLDDLVAARKALDT